MTICIIPARAKIKSIKKKNIIIFNGKPIIYYAINLAKKSKLFSRIIPSNPANRDNSIIIPKVPSAEYFSISL